jgi:diguanylate cyclase (GGDEF)-like protein
MLLFPEVRSAPMADLAANRFFYIYQLIGTCAAFATAAYVAGGRAERLQRAESFYQTLAEHDPLTGLLNTRAFRDRYERSLERAARIGHPISLLLIDVDNLKRINDQHGHGAGNDALVHVANSLRIAKRTEDSAARWGGDEFVILLESGDDIAARRVANNVLARVRAKPVVAEGGNLRVTVTIGVCTAREVGAGDDLFSVADRALYSGKASGRDRAQFAEIG